MMTKELFTIGHSNHSIEHFIQLLRQHQIAVVADVRSAPYSTYSPQFNREALTESLKHHGVRYVFMGKELGARTNDPTCYVDGKVQYSRLAQTPVFKQGLERLRSGIEQYRVAMMCSEKDPITCHRTILVCRQLHRDDITIMHILGNGAIEANSRAEQRLLRLHKLQPDFFMSIEDVTELAYYKQSQDIAFTTNPQDDQ